MGDRLWLIDEGNKLNPGGSWLSKTGHATVTEAAGLSAGFGAPALKILADASQDPDFYEFGNPAAHAQSPDAVDKLTTDAERAAAVTDAVARYHAWLGTNAAKVAQARQENRLDHALYWLGYTLHGLEDLPAHQGMTNGEHAVRGGQDSSLEALASAGANVEAVLRRAFQLFGARLGALGEPFTKGQKGELFHPGGWDLGVGLRAYRKAGKAYRKLNPAPPAIRWDLQAVRQRAQEIVLSAI